MKHLTLLILLFAVTFTSEAQKFLTKTGTIQFYSETPMEKIEAVNKQVNAALDYSTGDFIFRVLMKSFEFPKALMQEHFNENYVESDKFPDAKFIGKVMNIKDVKIDKDGIYPVTVEGNLTLHGVTKPVSAKGTFEIKQGKITGKSKFNLQISDYNISIPSAVIKNIAKSIEITIDVNLAPAGK